MTLIAPPPVPEQSGTRLDDQPAARGPAEPRTPVGTEVDARGMELLAAHVPLTLLLDLAPGEGPGSGDILTDEQPTADDLSWLVQSS